MTWYVIMTYLSNHHRKLYRTLCDIRFEIHSFPFFLSPQDGKIRLYAIQGTTLKDEGKTIEAKGPITDMAYSNDGAYLAAIDEKKVATVYSVADGHSVNICPSCISGLFKIQYPHV